MEKFILTDSPFFGNIELFEDNRTYLKRFEDEIKYSIKGFKENLSTTINLLRKNYKKKYNDIEKRKNEYNQKCKEVEKELINNGEDKKYAMDIARSEIDPYLLQETEYEKRYLVKDYHFSIDKQIKAYFLLVYGFFEHNFFKLCDIIQKENDIKLAYDDLFDGKHYINNSVIYLNKIIDIQNEDKKLQKIKEFSELRNSITHENSFIRGSKKRWNSITNLIKSLKYKDTFNIFHEDIANYSGISQNIIIKKDSIIDKKGESIFFEFTNTKLVEDFIEYVNDFLLDTIIKTDCKYKISLKHNIDNFYISNDCKLKDKCITEQNGETVIKLKLFVFNTFSIKMQIHIMKKGIQSENIIIRNKLTGILEKQIQEKESISNTQIFINNHLLSKCNDKKVEILIEEDDKA